MTRRRRPPPNLDQIPRTAATHSQGLECRVCGRGQAGLEVHIVSGVCTRCEPQFPVATSRLEFR